MKVLIGPAFCSPGSAHPAKTVLHFDGYYSDSFVVLDVNNRFVVAFLQPLFRNPAFEMISISTPYRNAQILIADLSGKMVLRDVLRNSVIDVAPLVSGTYIGTVIHEGQFQRFKLVKR